MRVTVDGAVTLDVPDGWRAVTEGRPAVLMPAEWDGEPPAVVALREDDRLFGTELAAALLGTVVARLADSVVVDIGLDPEGRNVELLVAHRHRGVAVTTLERHHCAGDHRWVVAVTATDDDWVLLWDMAGAVVASLREPG